MLGILAVPAALDSGSSRAVAAAGGRVSTAAPLRLSERSELTVASAGEAAPAPAPQPAVVATGASVPVVASVPAPAAAAPAPAPVAPVATPEPEPVAAPAPEPEPEPEPAPPPAPAPAEQGYLGEFVVTCYAIHGRTATGEPTHSGGVAVDPAVIPYGTRIDIEGVGVRVANDTGPRLRGNRLDIWLPSDAACHDFGRQVLDVRLAA
jgi:3D (Asp-Asp-Asp) domain-containing protein